MYWKAFAVGNSAPPMANVTDARIAATTALDIDVPIARSSVLTPLADAVSVIGTERMMRVGMAA